MLVALSKAVQPLLGQPSTPRYNYRIMIFLPDLTQLQDVETLRTADTQIKDFLIMLLYLETSAVIIYFLLF